MDNFSYCDSSNPTFFFGEFQLFSQENTRIYEGSNRTQYENGELLLTSHRLIWRNPAVERRALYLPLDSILLVEEEVARFVKSAKLALSLKQRPVDLPPGPPSHASPPTDVVKFSFKQGGERSFLSKLHEALGQRQWETTSQQVRRRPQTANQQKTLRSGIGGIEKSIQQRTKKTDKEISKAFEDLDKLMEMAKPMVALAKSISGKIRDKQGDISDDETIQFKSYLLSLGISDPVTRDTHGSGQTFYRELAKEIFKIMEKPLKDAKGMMPITDVFCRVNRARGLELISPEDLLQGCKALRDVKLPMRMRTFDSGVTVLQLSSCSTESLRESTVSTLNEKNSLTAEELSSLSGESVILAHERLLDAESHGKACRDDSVEGLRFYPNLFLTREAT